MKEIFRLALRNLSRSKKRNVILGIAIAFGFFVVTAIDGLTSGAVNNLEDQITQLVGGTVLIGGYEKIVDQEEGSKPKLVQIIRDKAYVQDVIERSGVKYTEVSYFTSSTGDLIFSGNTLNGQVMGRDFENDEKLVKGFKIVDGNLEDIYREDSIVITEEMAKSLNVVAGDNIIYKTETIYGQNNVGDFTVAAIIKGNSIFQSITAYANIKTVNALVELPEDGYTTFTMFLKNKNQQVKAAMAIEQIIHSDGQNCSSRMEALRTNPNSITKGINKQFLGDDVLWEGTKYAVLSLQDEVSAIQTIMNVIHYVTTSILVVILLIVMVGVSNTYRMVLLERIREIGTMRALGMNGKDTGKVFTTEALILSVIAACAGLALAVVVMTVLGFFTINNESVSMFLNKGHITFVLNVGSIIIQYILMIVLTALAVRGSAKKAANLSPAEALRSI